MLIKWTRPDNYIGCDFTGYLIAAQVNRDSSLMEQHNFEVMAEQLLQFESGEEEANVFITRQSHFLCGWIDFLMIHEDNIPAIAVAEQLHEQLENYPVLEEDRYCEKEWEEACEYWEGMSLSWRIHYTQKYNLSPFSVRRTLRDQDDRIISKIIDEVSA